MDSSNIFLDRDIVVIGAQENAIMQMPKLSDGIAPTHIYSDGPQKLDAPSLKKVASLEEIQSLRRPFAIVTRSATMPLLLTQLVDRLHHLKIDFDHIDNLITGATISTGLLKKLRKEIHTDPNGNVIQIGNGVSDKFFVNFRRGGRGNKVMLEEAEVMGKVQVEFYGSKGTVVVGGGTTFVSTHIELGHLGSVQIGKDCMFSHGIVIGQTDQHPMFDLSTGARINYGKPISIGNHVWVGRDTKLLGGATIGDGSIVGAGAVTSSRFEQNVLIAGSPARRLRKGVLWARDTLASVQIDHIDQCNDKQGLHWAAANADTE
jgi:acetyltransferase-like isoleucine patch superfamily enzyme